MDASTDPLSNARLRKANGPIGKLYRFLRWTPPRVSSVTHEKSKASRLPSVYDEHLAEDIVLKQIYHCPELPTLVVEHLRTFLLTLQDLPDQPMKSILETAKEMRKRSFTLDSERHVQLTFQNNIGYPVSMLTEFLVLESQPSTQDKNLGVFFDVDCGIHNAIMDNIWYLRRQNPATSFATDDESTSSRSSDEGGEQNSAMWVANIESGGPPLGAIESRGQTLGTPLMLVEHKSPAAADVSFLEAMQSFAKTGALFEWKFCNTQSHIKVGHAPVGILPIRQVQTQDSNLKLVEKIIRSGKKGVKDESQTSGVESQQESGFAPSSESQASSDNMKKEKTFRGELDRKAMGLYQGIWVQACKHDLTALIFSSYKHSIFMIRDRETQSLYISDTLENARGSLNIIEVTLAMSYLACLDVDARLGGNSTDLTTTTSTADDIPVGEEDIEANSDDNQPVSSGSNNLLEQTTKWQKTSSDTKRARGQVDNGDVPAIFLYFRCGMYQSPFPAFLQRRQPQCHELCRTPSTPSDPPPLKRVSKKTTVDNNHMGDCDNSPSIFIYTLAGQGLAGDVWRAKLVFSDGSRHTVVVKIGTEEDLRHEELAYERLKAYGATGVPKFWGSFCDKGNSSMLYIILGDAGSPVSSVHRPTEQWMSRLERDEVLESLKSIHNAGVVHGDIRSLNLLEHQRSDGTRVFTIIDFHLTKLEGETTGSLAKIQREEVAQLKMLLNPWLV